MANVVEVIVHASDAASGVLRGITSHMGELGNVVDQLTAENINWGNVAYSATNLVISGVKKLIEYGEYASYLNETMSKTSVVFGDSADSVIDFGENAAKSLGMSTNAALTAASTYGNLFRSMGMASDKSAEMSTNLVTLAGDLASFNNLDPTEVLEKLRAGLTGESEPLKSLGVNINETTIKAKAMELGLYNGVGALDAAAKAQAAYALILEQTTLAQGDFARTSSGLANQERILAAEQENLKATAGELGQTLQLIFVPALIDSAEALNNFLSQHKDINKAVAETGVRVAKEGKTYEYYRDSVLDVLESEGRLTKGQRAVIEAYQDGTNTTEAAKRGYEALLERTGLITEAEFNAAAAADKLTESQDGVTDAVSESAKAFEDYINSTENQYKNISSLAQDLQKSDEDLLAAETDLSEYIKNNPWDTKGITDRQQKVEELKQEQQKMVDQWMANVFYDMAMADGELSQREMDFLLQYQVDTGQISQENADRALSYWSMAKEIFSANTGIQSSIDGLHGTDITNTVRTVYESIYQSSGSKVNVATTAAYTSKNLKQYASGGSFVVPSGYGYEGFNMGGIATASPGETVTVTPKNQVNNGGNNDALNATLKALPKMIAREIRQLEKY